MTADTNGMPVRIMAGIPAVSAALYHQIRFAVGDPTAFVIWPNGHRQLLIRDIEMTRARRAANVDQVGCPADFRPDAGLSGDRETATAQALAECLVRQAVDHAVADRSLPLIYADCLSQRGIRVECDLEMGVTDRRQKDDQEVSWLRESQGITESAIRMACQLVAHATADKDGILQHDGQALTSERLRSEIDVFLLRQGFINQQSIVAGGPAAADCHHVGSGPLRTGEPVIIDVFPMNRATRYYGDCTRTVVHGEVPPEVQRMHETVVMAKQAATRACRAGVTGEDVHRAATTVIQQKGYSLGLPAANAPSSYCGMVHGTGHGIGLEVHEAPLLDIGGPRLLLGDALTIEPGLYGHDIGGIRVEDMVIVTESGCDNLNKLPEGLEWK